MSALTARQAETLAALREHPACTPDDLALLLGTSPQGAAQTASSLVRRRLARRLSMRGRVFYEAWPPRRAR